MAFNKTDRPEGAKMRRPGGVRRRKKVCVFCGKDNVIDYKDTNKLKRYVSERGKILPRRTSRISAAPCAALASHPRCSSKLEAGVVERSTGAPTRNLQARENGALEGTTL